MSFTEEQLAAIETLEPMVCVSAGAGSGKTTILIERIAYLLAHADCWADGRPGLDRIAAITFTEKAAAEMKARLRRKFREAPRPDNSAEMHFWREMERQVDSARVTTIHAFCASILREHALRIGMDPEWGVLGDAEAQQLAEQCVVETLHALLEEEDEATLRLSIEISRKQLKQALLDMLARQWEFDAARGSGNYTDATVLCNNWQAALPHIEETFLRSLRHNQEAASIMADLSACDGDCSDDSDKREIQRRACLDLLSAIVTGKDNLAGRIRDYLAAFPRMSGSKKSWSEEAYKNVGDLLKATRDFLRDRCLSPEWNFEIETRAAQMTCDFHHVLERTTEACRALRRQQASFDFEDMINETLQLLRSNTAVRERVAESIRFLLIDEFQDTDERQLEIARLLAGTRHGPDLFIVGDAKQSIYYFRGAEVDLFKNVIRDAGNPLYLAKNFRALPDVLHFVNDFFAQTGLLSGVEAYQPMEVFRAPLNRPCVECFLPEGTAGKQKAPQMRKQDARFVAHRIREMCAPETALLLQDDRKTDMRPATYDDIVLLFRRGSYMEEYESALRNLGIPYNRIAGAGFFQRREVQDILALLKLILDPWDEESLVTWLRCPMVGLSDESLMRMALTQEGLAASFHADGFPQHLEQPEQLTRARSFFTRFHSQRETDPANLLRDIFAHTKIEAVLLRQHLGLQRVSNLRKIIQMADNFSHSRPATLPEFTHYLKEVTFRELREGEATLQVQGMGAVTLMSIHKAKGLEFPIVFVPEMFAPMNKGSRTLVYHHKDFGSVSKIPDDDGNFKTTCFSEMVKRFKQHEETMESARVLYVALTRARDHLVLCSNPDAQRFSWADTLNRAYSLHQRPHNARIAENAWQMHIIRKLPETVHTLKSPAPARKPDIEQLSKQIAPLSSLSIGVKTVSVSRLLARMTESSEGEVAFEPEDALDAATETFQNADPERIHAMARGSLVHRLFELWNFTADAPPDLDMLIQQTGLGLQQTADLKNSLLRIVAHFRSSNLWQRYCRAEKIEREIPFLLDIGPALVRGVVDAVVDNHVIVDYKTGKAGSPLEAHYKTQLCLYAAALFKIKGIMPEQGILWYADYGQASTIGFTEEDVRDTLLRAAQSCSPG